MENFLNDNEDILFHLEHLDLDRIIRFKEEEFTQAQHFPYAPKDAAYAMDSYKKVLGIIGEICGEFIAPNAPKVDEEGPVLDLATNQVLLNPAMGYSAIVQPELCFISR